MYYPTVDDVVQTHAALMSTVETLYRPLINSTALEGALARPQQAAYYADADIATQAAVLIGGLALAHPFEDGNKRIALMMGDIFLQKNGYWADAQPFEIANQILNLLVRTTSESDASDEFADWLRSRIRSHAQDEAIVIPGSIYDFFIDLTEETWGTEPHEELDGQTIYERREDFHRMIRLSQEDGPSNISIGKFDVFNGVHLFIIAEPKPGLYTVRAFARATTPRGKRKRQE